MKKIKTRAKRNAKLCLNDIFSLLYIFEDTRSVAHFQTRFHMRLDQKNEAQQCLNQVNSS
jgi:hypothetical protein